MRTTIVTLAAILTAQTLGANVNAFRLEHDDLTMKFGALQLRLSSKTGRLPNVNKIAVRLIGSTREGMARRHGAMSNGCRFYESVIIHPTVHQFGPADASLDFTGVIDERWLDRGDGTPEPHQFGLVLQMVDDWGDLVRGQGRGVRLVLHDGNPAEGKAYDEFVQSVINLTITPSEFVTPATVQQAQERAVSRDTAPHEARLSQPGKRPSSPPTNRTVYVPDLLKPDCTSAAILPPIQIATSGGTKQAVAIAER